MLVKKVDNLREVKKVARLAREIWWEHYVPVIGRSQVDYMLEKFQSVEAITTQIESGYEYYILLLDEEAVGYLALVPNQSDKSMMVSKIYVKSEYRGQGCGTRLLEFTRKTARERDIERLWLRVNKHNESTIDWYKNKGFTIKKEDRKDIGAGFYMDDYIMEMDLGRRNDEEAEE